MIRRACIGLLFLGWSAGASADCRPEITLPAPADLAEETPDVVTSSPRIQDVVEDLGCDPVKIYEFVRNEFRHELYFGLLKGPEGTLLSRGGNDYDLNALLVSLLRVAGVPARFVRGRIAVTAAQASGWFGTHQGTDAQAVLVQVQPSGWGGDSNAEAKWEATSGEFHFLHVWVEANVPMARYRGAGLDARGAAWIPLDASYKLTAWRQDPALPIGSHPDLTFDYGLSAPASGSDDPGYYHTVATQLPTDLFERQIQRYLATSLPGTSVTELTLSGPILAEAPGVLPNALPFRVLPGVGVSLPRRNVSLLPLHTSGTWPVAIAGSAGANHYRYRFEVYLCTPFPPVAIACDLSPSLQLLSYQVPTAALANRRVTVSFPPDDPSDLDDRPDGYATTAACSITTRPTLWVDGQIQPTAPPGTNAMIPEVCDPVELQFFARVPQSTAYGRSLHTVFAGGTYVAALDSFSSNPVRTAEIAAALVAAQDPEVPASFPISLDATSEDRPFVDNGQGAFRNDGFKNDGELYLAQHFGAQEALTGGLLHLAGARYYEIVRDGAKRAADTHHELLEVLPYVGLVSAGFAVDYILGVPFSVRASNLLVDVRGISAEFFTRAGALRPKDAHAWQLFGHTTSAAEHVVWEEIGSFDAVSTVKGFQLLFNPGIPELDLIGPRRLLQRHRSCSS